MDGRLISDQQEYVNTTKSGHESPPPCSTFLHDMKMTSTSSPKRSKRGIQKRVVSVPIRDGEGSSDSWAWRKYGQKPIKGSPFPRGYYKCASSKGCPARKQVDRSKVDPTMLVVTYSCEHNHPDRSVRASHQNPSTLTSEPRIDYNPEENKFADLGRPDESSMFLGDEFDWFGGMERAPCAMLESPVFWETTGAASEADVSGFFLSRNLSELDNASNDDRGRGVCVFTGAEEELVDWRRHEDCPLGYIAGRLPVQYLREPVDHFLLLGPSRSRALNLRAECLMEVYLPGSNNALLQVLVNLKHLDLSYSSFIKMPDLSRACKLQNLDLHGCNNLVDVSSVQYLTKLECINLKGCTSLMSLPSLMALKFLCSLNVRGCSNLRRLPPSLGCLSSLTTLDLRNCKRIQNLPKGIWRLKSLHTLSISGCSMLMEHASRVLTPTIGYPCLLPPSCSQSGPEGMLIVTDHQEHPRVHSSLHTSGTEVSTSYQHAGNYAKKITLQQTQEERICNNYNSTGLEDAAKPSSLTTQDLERHREMLKGYMSKPVEAIHQANAFYDVQRTVESLNQQGSDLHESASLQDLLYCLEELQENVPETMERMDSARVSKASFRATLARLGSSFVGAEEYGSLLAVRFLAISDQEEELDAEIARLLAKRQELIF